MKQGGSKEASSGFTIVETLIVLAVTGALFISAIALVNGKQNKTQFTTAINGLQQQLQQTINETISGYYPNNNDFTCKGTTSPVTFNLGSSSQGTNGGCIFLGKAIQFGTGSGDNASQLGILPLVGNQFKLSTFDPIINLTQARPRAVYPAGGTESGVPTDATSTDLMQNGLTVASNNQACGPSFGYGMCYFAGATPVKTGIAAIVAGDSTGNIASTSNGDIQSGTQQMSLYGVNGSLINQDFGTASKNIGNNSVIPTTKLVSATKISICIASGSTSQSGLFTIDQSLHVSLAIKGTLTCA